MLHEVPLFFSGPLGLLQGRYAANPLARGAALVCNPNPLEGGTLLNKVVSTLQRSAWAQGYSTLRFNYRGVGQSEGEASVAEEVIEDAEAAAVWLSARHSEAALTVLGFSFGGYVAAGLSARLCAAQRTPRQLVMVAPAVYRISKLNFCPSMGLVVIQPEQDEVLSAQKAYDWAAEQGAGCQLYRVPESGHFFHGKLGALQTLVSELL